ncbi:complex I NDUFA9 subunit family protein [Henriciella barbarensis]|uniref:Complex I NDUFA9 subunit family protein n=1 Tax=Henriciella barbarensis TaxID=86342 RepID=A0A399QX55_9PROT|nr:complex I NDUFA9 subunit family protein [Henriciella barbarensis]RIJ23686.1 complex I NDUFA9 subunit family protein [Henriciella barbarensis]
MSTGLVTLFGGSGFIGHYAARALVEAGYRVRIAVRRPHLAGDVRLAGPPGWIDIAQANVRNRLSVERAIEGADAVVNLVGILYEKGQQSFESAQLGGAQTVAECAAAAGIKRFVQMSAIGANENSESDYARTKALAEQAVRNAIPKAVILRPSIVFGPEDDFFNKFAGMAAHPVSNVAPFLPAIGGGKTKLQPVYAGDVAEAIAAAVSRDDVQGKTYELGGPSIYTFNELYDFIGETIDRKRYALPLPYFVAKPMGLTFGAIWKIPFLPLHTVLGPPPITGDQVDMLKTDNVVAENALTLKDLGVNEIESIEAIVPTYLWRYRAYGEFHQKGEA